MDLFVLLSGYLQIGMEEANYKTVCIIYNIKMCVCIQVLEGRGDSI